MSSSLILNAIMLHYRVTGMFNLCCNTLILHNGSLDTRQRSFSSNTAWMFYSCHHELETARINGLLGNIDANTGDPQTGVFFSLSLRECVLVGNALLGTFKMQKLVYRLTMYWICDRLGYR